jgi:hypothetical protein
VPSDSLVFVFFTLYNESLSYKLHLDGFTSWGSLLTDMQNRIVAGSSKITSSDYRNTPQSHPLPQPIRISTYINAIM